MGVGSSPIRGTTARNGAQGAAANRAEVPPDRTGRRAPSCVPKDGQSLGAGGPAALPPDLGRAPTLPRCRDTGVGGNPVRAIRSRPAARLVSLGTLERLHRWRLTSQRPTLERRTAADACFCWRVAQTWIRTRRSWGQRRSAWRTLAGKRDPRRLPPTSEPAMTIALLGGAPAGSGPGTSLCIGGCPWSPAGWYPSALRVQTTRTTVAGLDYLAPRSRREQATSSLSGTFAGCVQAARARDASSTVGWKRPWVVRSAPGLSV
jgi:hypothetical protein